MAKEYTLTEDAARRTAKAVQQVLGNTGDPLISEYRPGFTGQFAEGILSAHLEAATGSGTIPAFATFKPYTGAGYISINRTGWYNSDVEHLVTNRSQGLWLPSGAYIMCMWINGEWRPMWPYSTVIGKTDSTLTKSSTGTVSVYYGTSATTLADTAKNITVYNRYATVSSSKWVACQGYYWGFELIAAECG